MTIRILAVALAFAVACIPRLEAGAQLGKRQA